MKRVGILMVFLMLALVMQAAYLDAEPGVGGNTVRASDGSPSAWWTNATSPDGLWGYRAFGYDQDGVFNGDTKDIYEASGTGSGAEDCVPVITTISELNPGTGYKIDVVYWSSDSQNWNVRAGFDAGSMSLFDRLGDTDDGATAGTLIAGTRDGDRDAYSGLVGYTTADVNGEIKVYLDDKPAEGPTEGWYDRSWYDGLLYEVVNIINPVPADDPAGGNPVPVTQDLSWTLLGTNVEYIDLYLGVENEPNLVLVSGNKKLDFAPVATSYDPGTLNYDTTYYWRVDAYEPNTLPGSTDYLATPGPVWTFTTVPEAPVVSAVDPAYTAVDAGEPSILLSVTGLNITTYQWYKDGDPLADAAGGYAGTDTDTLEIFDVQLADEGYYYCIGTNSAGSDTSEAGRVMIHRPTSYYDFDSITTLADGNDVFIDSIDGYHAVLSQDSASAGLPTVSDANQADLAVPFPGTNGLLLDNGDHAADPNGQYLQIYPGVVDYEDITISLWVHPNGGSEWQRVYDFGSGTVDYMFLTPDAGGTPGLRYAARTNDGTEQQLNGQWLAAGSWYHVAVTLDGDTGRLYRNGELVATNTGMTLDPIDIGAVVNYIGNSQYDADPEFNGLIDELKIYNYALSPVEVGQEYLTYADPTGYVCNYEIYDMGDYDVNGDCLLNLPDFAAFAVRWLESDQITLP